MSDLFQFAVCVLQSQRQGFLSSEQLIATIAVFFAVLAGLASSGPSNRNVRPYGLRRSFIIAAVLSLIATVFLAVGLGLFSMHAFDYLKAARGETINIRHSHANTNIPPVVNRPMDDADPLYTNKVIGALKFTALIGESLIIGSTLVCLVLSAINAKRARGNYAPAPVQDTVIYYEKNRR